MVVPRFCPYRACSLHTLSGVRAWSFPGRWFRPRGFYYTDTYGWVKRFHCCSCGRSFSESTFRLDYFVKRRLSYQRIEQALTSCSGLRAIGRTLGCSVDSVSNRISRLSRQYISAHSSLITTVRLREPLAADGFQSFAVSQYYPNNIHLLCGADSQLVYDLDYVTIRRTGAMSESQRLMRLALEIFYRASPKGITRSFRRIVTSVSRLCATVAPGDPRLPLIPFRTDCKREYAVELKRNRCIGRLMTDHRFEHQRISSRRHRDYANPLFAVNYLDREIRKDLAEHVRETTRFARNVNNSMERMWLYLAVHNYRKRHRINPPAELPEAERGRVHAQVAGFTRSAIEATLASIHTRRRFLSLSPVRGCARITWQRLYHTPLRGVDRTVLRRVKRLVARSRTDVTALAQEIAGSAGAGISRTASRPREYLPAYAIA